MAVHEIDVCFKTKAKELPSSFWFRKVISLVLSYLKIQTKSEIGITIVCDAEMRELNRTYRRINRTTDILSFGMKHTEVKNKEVFSLPPDNINHLGEIVISMERAISQALSHNHSVNNELIILITHGILHLDGYDHRKRSERDLMFLKQAEIAQKVIDLI